MIFPWMFDEIHALKPFKAAADILAKKEDWPPLYDAATLKTNKVLLIIFHSYDQTVYFMILFLVRCLLLPQYTMKICM